MTNPIDMIMSQTTYTNEEAQQKLDMFGGDPIKVIKDFMGIKEKPTQIKSVNQEIFKQIRYKLDESMRNYNQKNPVNINQVIDNINESEDRLQRKQNK
jgi:hypothetical protein